MADYPEGLNREGKVPVREERTDPPEESQGHVASCSRKDSRWSFYCVKVGYGAK